MVSDSNESTQRDIKNLQIHAKVTSTHKDVSEFQCSHSLVKGDSSLSEILVGDTHLVNCNMCGAYFPKSGSNVIRALKRHTQLNKLFTSDILRSMYSQCQTKASKPEYSIKVSNQYQEVRNLIIDWLAEVSETLRLDI